MTYEKHYNKLLTLIRDRASASNEKVFHRRLISIKSGKTLSFRLPLAGLFLLPAVIVTSFLGVYIAKKGTKTLENAKLLRQTMHFPAAATYFDVFCPIVNFDAAALDFLYFASYEKLLFNTPD